MPRRRSAHRRSSAFAQPENNDLVRYWLAHLLSMPALWRRGHDRRFETFEHPELLACFGIEADEAEGYRYPPEELTTFLDDHSLAALLTDDAIVQNLERLGAHLHLSDAEKRLLTFVFHLHNNELLYQAGELLGKPTYRRLIGHLSALLEQPADEVSRAFQSDAVLRASDMLQLHLSGGFGRGDLTTMLEIEADLTDLLQQPGITDAELTRLFFHAAPVAQLAEADFVEMADELALLKTLLQRCATQQRRGVNLLLYGPPGTGKTQLALVLANALGQTLVTVPETDKHGDFMRRKHRFGRYIACQRVLQQQDNTVVLYDEAEETLCDMAAFPFMPEMRSPRATPKSALVDMLETNTRPTIWIVNRVNMDPAFLRRFSHVVKMDTPGPTQRSRLVRAALQGEAVAEPFLQAAEQLEQLSPAMLHAAVDFAHMAGAADHDIEALLTRNINARLEAGGVSERLQPQRCNELPWRADCLRASEDVASLLDDMRADVPARLCLYGPPGTGKTAWVRQLARRLGQPLMVRQAADLLDMYVGQTEKHIAATFARAEQDGAVLLIDEADSFIGSRQHAQRSWEVSHVNQFLAAMEQYQGVFIATTNLLERIDAAAMRRFDFTIAFDYLDSGSALTLFRELATAHAIALADTTRTQRLLASMPQLTPGDFAAVHRRLQVRRNKPDSAGLAALLQAMQQHKQQQARPIGFSAVL